MSNKYLGDDTEAALQVVRSLYGADAKLRVIGEGYENLIIVVDEKELVRFPRSEEFWNNGRGERFVLEKLANSDLSVPKVLKVSEDPAYMVLTYQQGNYLTVREVRNLPEGILRHIGEETARFAHRLHHALDIDEVRPYLTVHDWSYDDYLKRVLVERTDPNPAIDKLAKRYYSAWLNKKESKKYIIHDDLHKANLLFSDSYDLVGVLDFGAVCIGTAEQELRQTYRLGDAVLDAAATEYEKLSGESFDRETAKVWTVTQELGAYCREDEGVAHDRAKENLKFWFPELSI